MGTDRWQLFQPRTRYVVQQSFKSMAGAFHEGETLTFVYTSPLRRGGVAYFFTDKHGMSRRCEISEGDLDHIRTNMAHWFAPDA